MILSSCAPKLWLSVRTICSSEAKGIAYMNATKWNQAATVQLSVVLYNPAVVFFYFLHLTLKEPFCALANTPSYLINCNV